MSYQAAGGLIDTSCPVEWEHPLNRALVGCWQVIPNPGWRGGATLRDLVRGDRKPHDAPLSNMSFPATATSGWAGPKGRTGGFGCLGFDGADDFAEAAISPTGPVDIPAAGSLAVSCWVNFRSVTRCKVVSTIGGGTFWQLGLNVTTNEITFFTNTEGSTRLSAAPSANRWYHVTGVADRAASLMRIYLDGAEGTYGAQDASVPTCTGISGVCLGALATNHGAHLLAGYIDDVRIYNRALSAAQVRALYDQSRRGHPDTLRWLKPISYFYPLAAGGTPGTATPGPLFGEGLLLPPSPSGAASVAPAALQGEGLLLPSSPAGAADAAPAPLQAEGRLPPPSPSGAALAQAAPVMSGCFVLDASASGAATAVAAVLSLNASALLPAPSATGAASALPAPLSALGLTESPSLVAGAVVTVRPLAGQGTIVQAGAGVLDLRPGRTVYWSPPSPREALWNDAMTIRTVLEEPVYKGQRLQLDFSPDGDDPIVISGWTLAAYVSRAPTNAGVSAPLLTVAPTVTVAASGTFSVAVSSAQMLTLGMGRFFMDVWRTDAGAEGPLAEVEFVVRPTPRW